MQFGKAALSLLGSFALICSIQQANAQSGWPSDPYVVERVQRCLMSVTATTMIQPQQEAHRKVVCYEGTRGMSEDCERSVASTMSLPSNTEAHYRGQCHRVSPN